MCKLTNGHFGQIIGPPLLEAMLAKYGLALFARVVATLQVVCGILLLSQRFSTIGAVMLVPMNLSILAVTISQNWNGTPYVNGFFTLLNILLLIYDWHKLKVLVNPKLASSAKATVIDGHTYNIYNIAGILFASVAIVASRLDIIFTNAFAIAGFVCFGYAIIQVKAISKMQAIIVALVMLNMIAITLAGRLVPFAQKLVLYNTLLILVLTGLSFVKKLNPADRLPAV
ncbi:hypothetical protein [Mucilaginibacter terrigena]|uniref:hypothetical protein n=1 Tax=Mucilaginibacter terrigena TaxID=2492395 RepID=UPI0013967F49